MDWTYEMEAYLKLLMADKLSFSKIARAMNIKFPHNPELTRNAIAGKILRIKRKELKRAKNNVEHERPTNP